MKTLLLWRHAKAESAGIAGGDHQRNLASRGHADAQRVAGRLVLHGPLPEIVLCSDSRRTMETADALDRAAGRALVRVALSDLYHAGTDDYLRLIGEFGGSAATIMIVAHNPTVEAFAEAVTGDGLVRVRPGDLAVYACAAPDWSAATIGHFTRTSILSPRDL